MLSWRFAVLMALVPAVVPEETAPSAAPTELPDNATAAPTLAPTLTPYPTPIGSTDGVKLSGNGTVQILVVTGTGGRVEEDRRRLEEDGELPYASAPTHTRARGAIALVGDGRDTSYLRVQSCKFNENEGRLASAIYVYHGDSYFKSNKVYEDRIRRRSLGFNATAYGCHNDELNITAGEEAFAYCDADSSSGINVVEALIALIAIVVGCVLGALCWYLAGQTDPELVSVFGFARLQSTDALTYLVVGLSGYVVVADVLADDDAGVADDSLTGTKDYVAFEVGEVDDDAAGSAYDWVNACGDAGALAQGAIYPIVFVKFVDTEADSWVWKFVGIGVELYSTLQILGMLLNFSLNCLMELPTGEFYIPVDADDALPSARRRGGGGAPTPSTTRAVCPSTSTRPTSFFCTMLSGLVHVRRLRPLPPRRPGTPGGFERDW
ncbi:hypothetical protein JL720_5425 [Aureococcus anophagefferens]|nr:hypothetical protein JL720_5425 [Aureococcus anophagefferens]